MRRPPVSLPALVLFTALLAPPFSAQEATDDEPVEKKIPLQRPIEPIGNGPTPSFFSDGQQLVMHPALRDIATETNAAVADMRLAIDAASRQGSESAKREAVHGAFKSGANALRGLYDQVLRLDSTGFGKEQKVELQLAAMRIYGLEHELWLTLETESGVELEAFRSQRDAGWTGESKPMLAYERALFARQTLGLDGLSAALHPYPPIPRVKDLGESPTAEDRIAAAKEMEELSKFYVEKVKAAQASRCRVEAEHKRLVTGFWNDFCDRDAKDRHPSRLSNVGSLPNLLATYDDEGFRVSARTPQ